MSDSDVLLAYMTEREVDEDGNEGGYVRLSGTIFAQNLKTAAATIGWMPDHLSEVMQELVADGRVVPDHADGDPERFANSRWRVVGEDEVADDTDANPLDDLTAPGLKGFATAHNIDLGDATLKGDIRAKIDAALAADDDQGGGDDDDDEPAPLAEMDVDQLIQYAGEHEIELPEGDASQEELVEYITEALAEAAKAGGEPSA